MGRTKVHKAAMNLLVVVAVLSIILILGRLDIIWMSFGTVTLVSLFGATHMMEKKETSFLKLKFSALFLLPLLFGISGISYNLRNTLFGFRFLLLLFIPSLGLLCLLSLTKSNIIKTNFQFSFFFLMIFSLAGSGLLLIGEFMSDRYFDTGFLEENRYFMMNLIFLAGGSLIIGDFFTLVGTKMDFEIFKSLKLEPKIHVKKFQKQLKALFDSKFQTGKNNLIGVLSIFVQIGIIILTSYALYIGDARWFWSGVISFGLTMMPHLFKKITDLPFPSVLILWISLAFFFHVLGGIRGYYDNVWWWDIFTHTFSASILAFIAFTVLLAFQSSSELIDIPLSLIPIVLILFLLGLSVIWETYEFLADQIFGTNMQYGLEDTVFDMIFNSIGAALASLLGIIHFR